jgi:NAD(P)-dependent dehydrogenase (short-subunit alcohol dehydrogenase family)
MSVVVITGAGQGQGAAEARLLAARGTTVIATDLTEAPAEDLAGADYRPLDVTDQVGRADLAKDLAERHGRVHGLVANAGITWRARLLDVTPEDVRRVHEVNVTGALLAIQAIAPLMTAGGSIVLVGSAAALTGHFRSPTPPASGRCAAWPRPHAWNWATAGFGSTPSTPATSRPR